MSLDVMTVFVKTVLNDLIVDYRYLDTDIANCHLISEDIVWTFILFIFNFLYSPTCIKQEPKG